MTRLRLTQLELNQKYDTSTTFYVVRFGTDERRCLKEAIRSMAVPMKE